MSEIKFMHDKEFNITLINLPDDDRKIEAGTFNDDEISVVFTIHPIEKQKLNFKVRFKKHPQTYPFWVKIDVKINEESDHFIFARFDDSRKESQKNFHTVFTKKSLSNRAKINYKLHHIPANISSLYNPKCLCYLNSVIQILFHLSKFRSIITSQYDIPTDGYLKEMRILFNNMIECNGIYSPEPLAISFGWPEDVALGTQQDASEFLDFLLNDISTHFKSIKRKKLENLFTSKFVIKNPNDPHNIKDEPEIPYIIKTEEQRGPITKILPTILQKDDGILQFERFPEVLFIQVDGELGTFEDELDLSKFQSKEKVPHNIYTLSGLIIREARSGNNYSGHYKCLVRSPCEDIWHYFSDDVQGFYNTSELKKSDNDFVSIQSIYKDMTMKDRKKSLFENRIRILMYVANDSINGAFNPDTKIIPKKKEEHQNENKTIEKCKFKVITNDNLIEHINNGNNNFIDIEESCYFTLTNNQKKSDLYEKVSSLLKIDKNSFNLRIAEEQCGGAPSGYIIENSDSLLEFQNDECTIYCFIEDKIEKDIMTVPIVFLSFEFRPLMFLSHLANNLDYSRLVSPNIGPSHQAKSQQARRINNSIFEEFFNNNIKQKDELSNEDENKEFSKYNFHHLATLFLKPNSTLASIKSKLIEKLGKNENSKIGFYLNENELSNIDLVSFKEIEIDSLFKTFNNKNTGRFIYVQCLDEIMNNKILDNSIDRVIDVKFLFFKYKDLAFGKSSFPRTLPLSFLMEKFSIPITFCKLDDCINKKKTFLFPVKNEFELDDLYKIICTAMNENYSKNNFMQIFLSFRENTSPFAEQITDMQTLNRALYHNLKEKFMIKSQNLYTSKDPELPENFSDDSDVDYDKNHYIIHIHYKIFPPSEKKKRSFRFYFSEDSINVNFVTQFLMKPDKRVSSLIKKFLRVYSQYDSVFSEKDKKSFELIKNDQQNTEKLFSDVYQILKITNCKISNISKYDYYPGNNISIRVQRIPDYLNDPNFVGIVPAYYGARYNSKNLVIAFGDPFLFPIYKDDLEISSERDFLKSEANNRLNKCIKEFYGEKHELLVTNYDGIVQEDIDPYNFEDYMIEKANIQNVGFSKHLAITLISYHNEYPINANMFLDETLYFKKYPFKVLQK